MAPLRPLRKTQTATGASHPHRKRNRLRARVEAVAGLPRRSPDRAVDRSFRGDDSTNSPTRWITCHGRPPSYSSPNRRWPSLSEPPQLTRTGGGAYCLREVRNVSFEGRPSSFRYGCAWCVGKVGGCARVVRRGGLRTRRIGFGFHSRHAHCSMWPYIHPWSGVVNR
jgi:hypothetical protein